MLIIVGLCQNILVSLWIFNSVQVLSNPLEFWPQYSQTSQVYCYDFSKSYPSGSAAFIQDFLVPTLERQKAVSAHL